MSTQEFVSGKSVLSGWELVAREFFIRLRDLIAQTLKDREARILRVSGIGG